MIKYNYIFVLSILLSSILSCQSEDHFRKSKWKYTSGYHIGDVIDFSNEKVYRFDKEDETIFYNGELVAKLKSVSDSKVEITSIEGKSGVYTYFGP